MIYTKRQFRINSFFITILLFVFFSITLLYSNDRPKIGLALSGGGARGLAHIGALKVIEEMGIKIDYIAGTSIGAVIGGLYAIGYTAQEIEDIVIELDWDYLFNDTVERKEFYIGEKRWKEYYNVSFVLNENFIPSLPQGFISGNNLINFLFDKTYYYNHIQDFNDLPIPFACVATDLLTGEMIVYRSGNLTEAIRASVSIPSLLEPFLYEDRLTIDGGIKMNLPTPIATDMGADIIIAVKVTSDLRGMDRLTNPITVLDQTINISSTERKLQAAHHCDILIEPDLSDFVATNFNQAESIIMVGEEATRSILSQHPLLDTIRNIEQEKAYQGKSESLPLPQLIEFNNIFVSGNKYLSSAKVREYTKLKTHYPFSKEQIINGIEAAHKSNLFTKIYPVIEEYDAGYTLTINTIERTRNRLGVNIRYNEHDDIIISSVLEMRNYLGNNSNFITALSLGGPREILIDYVKNFGREWGAYFRLFPYVGEQTLYYFNEDRDRFSNRSLEYGINIGLGGYFNNRLIIEPYLFTFYKKLYRSDDDFFSSGLGIKLYYETLDDTTFPMSGTELFLKHSFADENVFSDYSYNKSYGRFQYLIPIYKGLDNGFIQPRSPEKYHYAAKKARFINRSSLKLQFEYASYFSGKDVDLDPFYLGGIDSFIGLRHSEKSEPIYKTLTIAARLNIKHNFYLDLQLNIANLSEYDFWHIDDNTLIGGGVKIGYKTLFAPLRIALGVERKGNHLSYISLGYDFDAFEFSRR